MDQMVVAFWMFSGLIIAANICIRLWTMEPAVRRSYAIFPPNLSDDVPDTGPDIADDEAEVRVVGVD